MLENFVKEFFGDGLTKTLNADGTITWNLPCDLATGLPENPRLPGEGLACYFKRLFLDGIIGLQGEKGDTGDTGATGPAGVNAYSTISADFTEPAVNDAVNIFLTNASWVAEGIVIFVENSGYYRVNSVTGNTVNATFVVPGPVSGGVIAAGNMVVAAGERGPAGEDA